MSAGRNPEEFFKRYKLFFETVDRHADEIKNVLVIGANDGQLADPVGQCWREHWKGYFIEPDPTTVTRLIDFLTRAKRKHQVFQVACNASDNDAQKTFYRMVPTIAKEYQKVTGDHGSALTGESRHHIAQRLNKHLPEYVRNIGIDACLTTLVVDCFSPYVLLDMAQPQLVQIDVEGMEYDIVIEILHNEHKPLIILYEHQHLPATACTILDNRAKEAGYTVTHLRNDTLLVKE